MEKDIRKINSMSEDELLDMINDTSQMIAKQNATALSNIAISYKKSGALVDNVEFWRWLNRNYEKSSIFSSNTNMQNYLNSGVGKERWVNTQLQGKGYEWDWIQSQRKNVKNIFKQYDAGDIANRASSDITETNLFTGNKKEYQMKAYISKTNPDLSNTPKDMTVVTNTEKTSIVRKNGYANVQEYKDAKQIKSSTDSRMGKIKSGQATPKYSLRNVGGAMTKAGIAGAAIGMGVETITSYKQWKNGNISSEEYSKEILKAGVSEGSIGAATTGIMIPVKMAITAAGITSLITIPIAFVVGIALRNIIEPCFGRGKYRKILNEAKYYQNIQHMYNDLVNSMENATKQYEELIIGMQKQIDNHNKLKKVSMDINKELKDLYDLI